MELDIVGDPTSLLVSYSFLQIRACQTFFVGITCQYPLQMKEDVDLLNLSCSYSTSLPPASLIKVILYKHREMDLLLVPYCADRDLDLIQWPPFLLASKVCSSFKFCLQFASVPTPDFF
jgi:hypothetical protein